MMIIDGKKEAKLLREEIKKEILKIKKSQNKVPGLTVILIGNYTPSQIYVKNKEKNSKEVGMNSDVIKYSNDVCPDIVANKVSNVASAFHNHFNAPYTCNPHGLLDGSGNCKQAVAAGGKSQNGTLVETQIRTA